MIVGNLLEKNWNFTDSRFFVFSSFIGQYSFPVALPT